MHQFLVGFSEKVSEGFFKTMHEENFQLKGFFDESRKEEFLKESLEEVSLTVIFYWPAWGQRNFKTHKGNYSCNNGGTF